MLRFLVRLALSAGVCICCVSATPAAEQETSALPPPSAGQSGILAALDRPAEFDFQERPLRDVLNYFKQKHKIEILVDDKALKIAGVGTDARITLTLKNITLRSALRLLLRQLELTYVMGDSYLLITSETEAESKLSLKVYPVEDLVTLDSVFRSAPPAADAAGSFPRLTGLGAGRGTLNRRDEASDFPGLIDMILATIAPDTWTDVGGPGTITENRNAQAIAVSQTDDVQAEIAVLLAALRRVRDEQIAAAKAPGAAAAPETSENKKPLPVRGYRLMRGPKPPGKSGWRPPIGMVGDSTPPRRAQVRAKKSAATAEPSGVEGGAATVKEVTPAKERTRAEGAASAAGTADKGAPANPVDEKLETWVAMIAKVVPQMIEPESWEPTGEGMIRAVGEAIVVRNTEEVQHRVARLMAELLPDYVPVDFTGPWGPWKGALQVDHAAVRLRPATMDNWPHEAEPRPCGEEVRAYEALREKCDLEFDRIPLIDALNRLTDLRHVQLYIDHHALSDIGVSTDTSVTHLVKGLSWRTVLELILDELKLAYLVRDGVLLITTKTAAETMLTTKVYPVFDLVVRRPNAPANRPGLDFQSLIDNIVANIAPDEWEEVGGPGSIEPFTNSGALVISQTTGVHQEIAEFLKALRAAAAAQKPHRADANQKRG